MPTTVPEPSTASDSRTARRVQLVAWALILVGVGLRIAQYAVDRSFWSDEALLALDIAEGSLSSLARSLPRAQIAPYGFLATERLLVDLGGTAEWVFRLLPLLAGIAVLPLFWSVARRVVHWSAALVALALVTLSQPLIYFSSELKPYSSDACIAIALLWLGVWWADDRQDRRRVLVAAVSGAAAVWLSQVAAFTLAGVGLATVGEPVLARRWREVRSAALVAAAWVVSFTSSVLVTRHSSTAETMAYMQRYWSDYFVGAVSRGDTALHHIVHVVARLFVDPAGFRAPYSVVLRLTPVLPRFPMLVLAGLAPVVLLAGVYGLWRERRRELVMLLVTPFVLLFAASALRSYPFGGRTSTFLVPAMALLVATGARYAWTSLRWTGARAVVVLVGLATFVPPMRDSLRLPYYREELRDVLQYVIAHREPGDTVYVYYGALVPLDYYERFGGIRLGPHVNGIVSREDPERYRADVRQFAGAPRLWIVLDHDYVDGGANEWSIITDEMDRVDRRLHCFERPGAQACLYASRDSANTASPAEIMAHAGPSAPSGSDSAHAWRVSHRRVAPPRDAQLSGRSGAPRAARPAGHAPR